MPVQRHAEATWDGDLKAGDGKLSTESGAVSAPYDFKSRFKSGSHTNPEELIAAAHAGCYSMALSGALAKGGHNPETIHTRATVHLNVSGPEIKKVVLSVEGRVPGLDWETFNSFAEEAKKNCPVSKALAAIEIELADVSLME